jgi:hypothetical protein
MKATDEAEQTDADPTPLDSIERAAATSKLSMDSRAAIAVGLVLLGVYWLTMGGHTYSVDGEGYLAGTRALLHHTTLLTPGSDLDGIVIGVPNKHGDLTSFAPLGTMLLFAPGLIAGKVIAAPFPLADQEEIVRLVYLSTNGLLTAATGAVLFVLCRRLGARRTSAVLLALTFGLGTWAWPHSQTDFSEPGTALVLTSALLALVRWWEVRTIRSAALTGFLAGCAVLTRSSTVLFVPIILLAGVIGARELTGRDRLRQAAAFCVGGAPAAVAFAVNAWIRFGSPLDNGYPPLSYATPIYEGIFGLFLSPGKGLIFYAPVCIVVIFAARASFLHSRRYTLTVAAMIIAHLTVYARFAIWSGENAYGPRYLVPLLPSIVALLAPVIDTGTQWVRGVRVAAVVGFLVPGLLGSLMYFNAVYFLQQPHLLADVELPSTTPTQQFMAWNFYPRTSPLMEQFRSLPDLFDNTRDRLHGESLTPMPAAYEERIHWYARSVELDTWWAWWPVKDEPTVIYGLLLVPIGLLVAGIRMARRSWRDDQLTVST